jgi:hypothetical protein
MQQLTSHWQAIIQQERNNNSCQWYAAAEKKPARARVLAESNTTSSELAPQAHRPGPSPGPLEFGPRTAPLTAI